MSHASGIASFVTSLMVATVRLYRWTVSPYLGPACRFFPSCSEYAEEALRRHGAWRGFVLIVRRLVCCHPFHPGGVDPVPERTR